MKQIKFSEAKHADSNLKGAKPKLSIGVPMQPKLPTGIAQPKLVGGMKDSLALSQRLANVLIKMRTSSHTVMCTSSTPP